MDNNFASGGRSLPQPHSSKATAAALSAIIDSLIIMPPEPPLFEGVDGLTDGLTSGFTDGFTDGFTEGFTDGLTAGRTDGLTAGLIAGLAEGRAKAIPLEVKSIMPDNSEQSIFFHSHNSFPVSFL